MMPYKHSCLVALLAIGLWPGVVHAAPPQPKQAEFADPQTLLRTVRDNRRALVAVNLNLSPDESAAFWPVYDRYQKDLNAVGDRMAALIEDYRAHFADLSNDKALKLVNDYLAAETERLKVRSDYVAQFAKVLPGRTVARLYQIENKMDAVMRYDLAATIPVVDAK
jgi:hypothetical protein